MGQNAIYYKGKSYSGGGGGSGTEVIPNPQDTPTDTLETISIDGTVYDIESGSSDISVNPEYDTGTLLATISVDDVDHEIYAPEFESGALYGYIDPTTLLGSDKDIYIKYIGDNVISEWINGGSFNPPTQHATYDIENSFGRDISNDYAVKIAYTAGATVARSWDILVSNITTSWTIFDGDTTIGFSGIRINPSTNRYEIHTNYSTQHTLQYKTNNFTPISIDSIWHKTDETWHKDNSSKVIANPEDAATDTLTKLSVDGDVYGIKSYQEITKAEYDALPSSKLTDDILYCITDGGATEPGEYFNPVIYSTTEREIGVWTDGRPLYQKTFLTTSPSDNTSTNILEVTNLNIDICVKCAGVIYNALNQTHEGGGSFVLWMRENFQSLGKDYIACTVSNSSYYSNTMLVTIQYTKTTDTPGSGKYTTLGVPSVHYDDSEKIIGTWFGETLYEKTIEVIDSTKGSITVSLAEMNISKIIKKEGIWDRTNNQDTYWMDFGTYINTEIYSYLSADIEHNILYIARYARSNETLTKAYITLQYTKTTD